MRMALVPVAAWMMMMMMMSTGLTGLLANEGGRNREVANDDELAEAFGPKAAPHPWMAS